MDKAARRLIEKSHELRQRSQELRAKIDRAVIRSGDLFFKTADALSMTQRSAEIIQEQIREILASPASACPACGTETPRARARPPSPSLTGVYYYRCERCPHTWTVSKTDVTNVHHIRPLPGEHQPR